jgi:hypothetical protein
MTRRIRRLAVALGAPAVLVLATASYALASAGTTAPALTLTGYHEQAPKLQPEAGDLLIASGGINVVNAYGPVRGLGGTDTEHSAFLDTWTFAPGTVNVLHAPAPAPVLDLVTCSAVVVQRDAWWKFAGGTGGGKGATGSGHFTEVALFSFAVDRYGRCVFDQHGQMYGEMTGDPYMSDHGRVLRPVFFSVEVQFTGRAALPPHHQPKPYPTPTYTTPAPPVTTATVPAPTYSTTAPPVD